MRHAQLVHVPVQHGRVKGTRQQRGQVKWTWPQRGRVKGTQQQRGPLRARSTGGMQQPPPAASDGQPASKNAAQSPSICAANSLAPGGHPANTRTGYPWPRQAPCPGGAPSSAPPPAPVSGAPPQARPSGCHSRKTLQRLSSGHSTCWEGGWAERGQALWEPAQNGGKSSAAQQVPKQACLLLCSRVHS